MERLIYVIMIFTTIATWIVLHIGTFLLNELLQKTHINKFGSHTLGVTSGKNSKLIRRDFVYQNKLSSSNVTIQRNRTNIIGNYN